MKLPPHNALLCIGAGVGGLTSALALHRLGHPCSVVMRETSLSSSGGAVSLSRGALRVLDRLGLGSRIRATGQPATTAEVFSGKGKKLYCFDLGSEEVYTVPRPRLRQALVEAMPPGGVWFGTSFRGMDMCRGGGASGDVSEDSEEGEDGLFVSERLAAEKLSPDAPEGVERPVCVMLRDLSRKPGRQDYSVEAGRVIGADGGRSSVRAYIAQPGASHGTGVTVFRATVWNDDHETYPPNLIREIWGDRRAGRPGLRFGYVRMTPLSVYWWATVETGSPLGREDVVLRPFRRKLAELFADFPFRIFDVVRASVESEIDRTDIRTCTGQRSPWVDMSGRVVLTGDAARQSDLPYLHHGSSMAIEDGYALAGAIDGTIRTRGSRRPLDAYELERREETAALQRVWDVFDRLARSRNGIERFWNSQMLKITVARQMLEGRVNEKRDMRFLSDEKGNGSR